MGAQPQEFREANRLVKFGLGKIHLWMLIHEPGKGKQKQSESLSLSPKSQSLSPSLVRTLSNVEPGQAAGEAPGSLRPISARAGSLGANTGTVLLHVARAPIIFLSSGGLVLKMTSASD